MNSKRSMKKITRNHPVKKSIRKLKERIARQNERDQRSEPLR